MKINKLLMPFAAALLAFAACEEYDQSCYYPAPDPKSDIGKALTANTEYIYSIYNDDSYQLHQGVEVTELAYLNNEGRSMRTFWYKIDLTNPAISLECVTPNNNNFVSGANEVLSTMLSHVDKPGHKVLGGINTDFGGGAGPQGAYWKGGECLKDKFGAIENRPRFFVSISKDKKVEIGTEAEYKGYVAENGSDISELFCGSPKLVEDGKVNVTIPNDLDGESHPRTAIGIMPDKTTVYLMVVDGRRYTYSNGMYLSVLADMFKALGCEHALNLDGGGSSTFIVAGEGELGNPARMQVKNWPNDGGGVERLLHNGLAIIANTK
jgi:hypothetical protein